MRNLFFLKNIAKAKGFVFFILLYFLSLISVLFFDIILKLINKNFDVYKLPDLKNNFIFQVILLYLVFFILFLLLKIWLKNKFSFFSNENWFITLGKSLIPSIMAFGTAFFVTFLFIIASEYLPIPEDIKEWIKLPNQGFIELFEQIKNENRLNVFIWITAIVVAGPIYEEILFRGFLQESIERIYNKHNLDIIIVALVFSLFHISSLSNTIFAFVIGIFLSRQRKITGKINSSIWIHSTVNFTGLLYGIITNYKN